jgi:hypothetical protein
MLAKSLKPYWLSALLLTLSACGRPTALPEADQQAGPHPRGASRLPDGHPPVPDPGGGPTIPLPPGGSGKGAMALEWTVPEGWLSEPPANPMRRAQYRVPGKSGDAHCVVYYFGPGQGGAAMANAKRWASQFRSEDGGPATDSTHFERLEVGPIAVLLVEAAGSYSDSMATAAGTPPSVPDTMLLGAIAEGPDANWFFKFTGPRPTVESQRSSFMELIRSLRTGTDTA